MELEPALAGKPNRGNDEGHQSRAAREKGGDRVSEGLEHAGAREDDSHRDEVPRDDPQEIGPHVDDRLVVGEEGDEYARA